MTLRKERNILVVDDASFTRSLVRAILSKYECFNIIEASNALSALQKLREKKIDLLIADLHMPKMNGIEMVNAIRNDEKIKHIPVLMISGETEREIIVKAIDAGIDQYVLKPFSPEMLIEKVNLVFKKNNK